MSGHIHLAGMAAAHADALAPFFVSSAMFVAPAVCDTTAGSSPEFTCDLGAAVTWKVGDKVKLSVPVIAPITAANGLINTATVVDDQGRRANDTAPVNVVAQAETVSCA